MDGVCLWIPTRGGGDAEHYDGDFGDGDIDGGVNGEWSGLEWRCGLSWRCGVERRCGGVKCRCGVGWVEWGRRGMERR